MCIRDSMWIVRGSSKTFDVHARAADCLGERLEVRRRGDDAQLLLGNDVSRRRQSERQD